MLPVLIEAHGLRLGSAHTLTYLAVLLCVVVAPLWAARREHLSARRVGATLAALALVVLLGGRLHFALNHPGFYGTWEQALIPWRGSFHIGGGILALALAAPAVTRLLRVPLAPFADALVFPLGLSIAIARLGCFLHGCCAGRVCDLPWCLAFPAGSGVFVLQRELRLIRPDATLSLPVHPLQLYFVAAALAIAAVGYWLEPRRRYPGQVALVGLVIFSTTTALLELLRGPDSASPLWGPLRQLVWTGIALSVLSWAGLILAQRTHRHARPGPATGTVRS